MKLKNRTILITGGTSGIGLELATRLSGLGNTVIVTGRDSAKLDAIQKTFPAVHVLQSDVSQPEQITALYRLITTRFPALDVLINNAGIMRNLNMNLTRELTDLTREIDINLSGPLRMIQQFLPHLKTRDQAIIVNVSSGLAFIPLPISPVYCAAKAALHSFTQSLRVQLNGSSITVIELAPPAVETSLLRAEFEQEMKGEKAMDLKRFGAAAIAGIEAGKLEIRPGLSNVLKLMSRVAPHFMLNQMAKLGTRKT